MCQYLVYSVSDTTLNDNEELDLLIGLKFKTQTTNFVTTANFMHM